MTRRLERLIVRTQRAYDPTTHFAHQSKEFYGLLEQTREEFEIVRLSGKVEAVDPFSRPVPYHPIPMDQADGTP